MNEPADDDDDDDDALTIAVIADLERLRGTRCSRCSATLCGHEIVVSIAMGWKDEPCCTGCVAGSLGRPRPAFLEHVHAHVQHRDCFRAGWKRASELEGSRDPVRPACLFPERETSPATADAALAPAAGATSTAPTRAGEAKPPIADATWNAGDMSCGDLVLALRKRLLAMAAGARIHVTATDPAAPMDIPAWCTLTRHRLVSARHPDYLIQRRED